MASEPNFFGKDKGKANLVGFFFCFFYFRDSQTSVIQAIPAQFDQLYYDVLRNFLSVISFLFQSFGSS